MWKWEDFVWWLAVIRARIASGTRDRQLSHVNVSDDDHNDWSENVTVFINGDHRQQLQAGNWLDTPFLTVLRASAFVWEEEGRRSGETNSSLLLSLVLPMNGLEREESEKCIYCEGQQTRSPVTDVSSQKIPSSRPVFLSPFTNSRLLHPSLQKKLSRLLPACLPHVLDSREREGRGRSTSLSFAATSDNQTGVWRVHHIME